MPVPAQKAKSERQHGIHLPHAGRYEPEINKRESAKAMRTRANFLVAGLILCAGLAHGQNPPFRSGYWWLQMPRGMKLAWLEGYGDGQAAVTGWLAAPCLKHGETFTEASYKAAEKACIHDDLSRFDSPRNATNGQIVDGLDQFYADYRNKTVVITEAIVYVNEELNGKPQPVLDELARKLRQTAANQ
jgi:hypothetical protein